MSDEYNVDNALDFAIDRQPTAFQDAVNNMLQSKAAEALESMRTSVAQSIFAGPEETSDDDDDGYFDDLEDEDLDLDDDLEIDDEFDDIDLDIDLEGLEDDDQDA